MHRGLTTAICAVAVTGLAVCPDSVSATPGFATRPVLNRGAIVGRGSSETVTISEFAKGIPRGHRPMGITLGPDGNMWFVDPVPTDSGINYVIRVAPDGTAKAFPFGPSSTFPELTSIVTGPDNALWMTDFDDGLIVRMTTDGNYQDWAVPGVDGYPGDITVGPDHALWFTESENFSIGRITTSGKIKQFKTGINGDPVSIATGSDGALWFTEEFEGRIGRITTSGAVTEYSLGSANPAPIAICAGPDGALWFTEYNGIGRITTSGTITQYSGLRPDERPQQITTGPDGALWFTVQSGGAPRLDRITTSGSLTEYRTGITGHAGPEGIAAGVGNTLWFTEMTTDRVARATLSGS